MKNFKKRLPLILAVGVLVVFAFLGWMRWASTTKIALLNFQPFQVSNIMLSNTEPFVKYEVIEMDDIGKMKNYDFVMAFGMGLKTTPQQQDQIKKEMNEGVKIFTFAVTNPENDFCSIDSLQQERITGYLKQANKANYLNLARYVRHAIDGKKLFAPVAGNVDEALADAFFHLDESVAFEHVSEYEEYIKKQGAYTEGGRRIALVAGIHDPFSGNKAHLDSLIVSLQALGLNVYPISSTIRRLELLQEANPDAVIYFPHGRLMMRQPDAAVEWLKARNIPLFTPLTILQDRQEWESNPMGMFGGFMGQSVVMPELDGSIYPYSLVAQEKNSDGLYVFRPIPGRTQNFAAIVNNMMTLRSKTNADKKVAIFYFKGAGQTGLAAQGLDMVSSLFNFLNSLKTEGYRVDGMPSNVNDFEKLLMTQGAVLNTYAEGAFDDFLKNGNPELVNKNEYESWIKKTLPPSLYKEVTDTYGDAPGSYMSTTKNADNYLAIARISLGNIVLLPQPMAALGDDQFSIVHGAKMPPPHTYIGAYLWMQNGFKADALIHYGTHGSLEFTPQKQVALGNGDWPDRLVGNVPHFYYYTIGNVGESMMAKRRSYATVVSYLTPAFIESNTRSQFKKLTYQIRLFHKSSDSEKHNASLAVKATTIQMGLHRELRLDSALNQPYTIEDIERIENFAEEISSEKINGELYVSGVPYVAEKIRSTVVAMSADPIAFGLSSLDKLRNKVTDDELKSKSRFNTRYLEPARALILKVMNGTSVNDELVCAFASITQAELMQARQLTAPKKPTMPTMGGRPQGKPAEKPTVDVSKEQIAMAQAIMQVENSIHNIIKNQTALEQSPELEFKSLLNAMSGGYVAPSSGGDAVANPAAVPTGHNLYSVNAETTPSQQAWDRGVKLVHATLENYKKQHGDLPRKVSYTFWSSEFIESEGTTIAQVLYMLGVEPVWDTFGRVSDLRLIPSETLGRPRIDIVVQTSGQFRDLAASRLMLISKAVDLAASATDELHENRVASSTVQIERDLVEQGIAPRNARQMALQRVFGGINGNYGTGIQEMITSSDKWDTEQQIAETYMNNMGAAYGSDQEWGAFQQGLLKTVLQNTDVVVQPRQNNSWGALSLDHVYEFMGGMNLAVRNVTGKDPEAYLADYRNRHNMKMQELKEAIGVESRATVLNPTYVKEVMKGENESAAQITDVVTNTFGWNVTKPDVIDNELWDGLYDMYVRDTHHLGTQNYFKTKSPMALQEITAVMMESARKGMWKASETQLNTLATLHTELVKEFGSSGTGFAGGNTKLQQFISQKVSSADAQVYHQKINQMTTGHQADMSNKNGMVLKKQQVSNGDETEENSLNGLAVVGVVLILFVGLLFILRKKRMKRS